MDEDAICDECGYDRTLHRAYARIDGGGKELGAYLAGRWHPFRPSERSTSDSAPSGGDGKGGRP